MTPNRIVGEVSKTWNMHDRLRDLTLSPISDSFGEIVRVNEGRGYVLESWQLSTAMSADATVLTETIVAVFLRLEKEGRA